LKDSTFFARLKRSLTRIYLRVKFFGFRYRCPFCIGGFREFHSAGFPFPILKEVDVIAAGYREHVRCPMCNSSNRERSIFLFLQSQGFFSGDKELRVLHIAPERALQKFMKRLPKMTHTSIDLASPSADMAMDINQLVFPNETFDLVICNNVLEHIPDDVHAMREIFRVLKGGGWALLMVPIATKLQKTFEDDSVTTESERERVFGQSDHVRIYAMDFEDRVREAGFDVERMLPERFLNKEQISEYAIDSREAIYWATKNG